MTHTTFIKISNFVFNRHQISGVFEDEDFIQLIFHFTSGQSVKVPCGDYVYLHEQFRKIVRILGAEE